MRLVWNKITYPSPYRRCHFSCSDSDYSTAQSTADSSWKDIHKYNLLSYDILILQFRTCKNIYIFVNRKKNIRIHFYLYYKYAPPLQRLLTAYWFNLFHVICTAPLVYSLKTRAWIRINRKKSDSLPTLIYSRFTQYAFNEWMMYELQAPSRSNDR